MATLAERGGEEEGRQEQTFSVGTRLGEGGRYELRKLVGTGAMAEVYKAVDKRLGDRIVAIKTLAPSVAAHPFADKMRELFIQEAKAIARVKDDHVVSVLDFGNTDDGKPFMVMEFLSGTDLGVFLRKIRRLQVAEAVDTILAVCAGVHACHLAGIVHRDLKPANIFLARTPNGDEPKVLDFSVAKLPVLAGGVERSTTELIVGTPSYMSPEQALGKPASPRSDQYSIAALLYRCLMGRPPRDDAFGSGELGPQIPARLAAILVRALHPAPESRFLSVHELGRALLPFASDAGRGRWSSYYRSVPTLLDPAVSEPVPTPEVPPSTVANRPVDYRLAGPTDLSIAREDDGTTVARSPEVLFGPGPMALADPTATTVAEPPIPRLNPADPANGRGASSSRLRSRRGNRDLTIRIRRVCRSIVRSRTASRERTPLLLPLGMALLVAVTFGVAGLRAARGRHRAPAPLRPPSWMSPAPSSAQTDDPETLAADGPVGQAAAMPPAAEAPPSQQLAPSDRSMGRADAEPAETPPATQRLRRPRHHPTKVFAIPIGYGPYGSPILR